MVAVFFQKVGALLSCPKLAKPAAYNGLVLFFFAHWDVPRWLVSYGFIEINRWTLTRRLPNRRPRRTPIFALESNPIGGPPALPSREPASGLQVRLKEVCAAEGSWTSMSLVKRRPRKLAGGTGWGRG